jgi:very-short-patch-repair endonuclease
MDVCNLSVKDNFVMLLGVKALPMNHQPDVTLAGIIILPIIELNETAKSFPINPGGASYIRGRDVTASDIADKVLEHIRLRGPSAAKLIADALGVDRSVVNHALYGPLRGKVRQAKDYSWSLAGTAPPVRGGAEGLSTNPHESLFRYYLDCLSQDDDSGVRTFADSKYDLDYVELGGWPFDVAQPDLGAEPLRKLIGRQRREARKKALWLGYPALVRRARSRKGWEGAFLEPLLIWPQDTEADDLAFLPEPMINTRALESLVASENVLEEAAHLADELGLDSSDPPPLDELAARLRDLRPEWDWKEALAPAPFRAFGELRQIAETGIYNAAVVVLTDRSRFTVGLERELTDLRTVSDAAIAGSSLGILLGAPGASTPIEGPLLEPAPLNAEQRTAVRQALTEPLTVITGPPGTGKSQVVTAILVNAAWRGLRVLFASKNNKAVDVVMERMNALSPRPIMLRLGTRALQEQLAQHITAILSARPTEEDRRAYDSVLIKLRIEGEALDRLTNQTSELIRLRNRVDKLERAAEGARGILPSATFRNAERLSISDAEVRLADLREALRRASREEAPFLEQLFWTFLKGPRQRRLIAAAHELQATLKPLGFQSAKGADLHQELVGGSEFINALKAASAYQSALKELSNTPDTGTLAAQIGNQTRVLAEISGEAWSSWTALLPERLNERDRTALGDYAAILRTISKADEEGGTIASQVWGRYYGLAAKTTKALPCWAVTSLSARGRVPFTAGEFDLVVIDEASQCDIASALPLLFRAKRSVVLGDPQQLRHISRLSEHRDQALMVKHNLLDEPGPSWGYRANGLFDLAAARAKSESIVVLRDHHRSHADIINFSNSFFYGGRLRVATDYRRLKRPDGPAVRWVNVKGSVVRPPTGGAVNQAEAIAVVEELRQIAITQRFAGEMGVVTPFRAQANLIEELIARDDTLAPILALRNFISETAHKFQGDERDLILFSPVVSRGTPVGATGFLKSQGNLFNVGITRARGALVVVGDFAACAACDVQYLSAFARYVAEHDRASLAAAHAWPKDSGRDYPAVARPELVSDWEKVFYAALVNAGLRPIPQFDIDQYILDFALIRPNGRRLNIEIDGERYHRDWDGELVRRDQLRNLRLIEMGWDVMRLWVYEVRDSLPDCVSRVARWAKVADALPDIVSETPSPVPV